VSEDIKKISVQCRRGMLELDFLLERFLENKYASLSETQKTAFARLLTYSDPELLDWLTGVEIPTDPELASLLRFISSQPAAG